MFLLRSLERYLYSCVWRLMCILDYFLSSPKRSTLPTWRDFSLWWECWQVQWIAYHILEEFALAIFHWLRLHFFVPVWWWSSGELLSVDSQGQGFKRQSTAYSSHLCVEAFFFLLKYVRFYLSHLCVDGLFLPFHMESAFSWACGISDCMD